MGGNRIVSFFKRNTVAYMFLLPWLVGFLVFTLYPMLYSLLLGFTNYDFTKPGATHWIGLANYIKMFGSVFGIQDFKAAGGEVMRVDPYYMKSLSVTFIYVFVSVPLKLIFALFIAMLMSQKLRFMSFYRAIYYIPKITINTSIMRY
jgi:multiple sugar transport system permease protein